MSQVSSSKTRDIVVSRILDASVEHVWKAWTDPALVQQWWGPEGYSSPSCQIDLREGGRYVFAMQSPSEQGSQVSYVSGTYKKIEPTQHLEFTQGLSDQAGNPLDPVQAGMPPDFPKEIRTTVDLKPFKCDMTELTVTEHDWPQSQMYVYSIAGLNQTIDKLARYIAKTNV